MMPMCGHGLGERGRGAHRSEDDEVQQDAEHGRDEHGRSTKAGKMPELGAEVDLRVEDRDGIEQLLCRG